VKSSSLSRSSDSNTDAQWTVDCVPPPLCRTGKLSQVIKSTKLSRGICDDGCFVVGGCTDSPSPKGDSGRSWCYVEAQLAGGSSWNYCAPVVDYDILRKEAAASLSTKVDDVRGFVSKLGKAQKAAEIALDMSALSFCCCCCFLFGFFRTREVSEAVRGAGAFLSLSFSLSLSLFRALFWSGSRNPD
jgi:hypothetical protein